MVRMTKAQARKRLKEAAKKMQMVAVWWPVGERGMTWADYKKLDHLCHELDKFIRQKMK